MKNYFSAIRTAPLFSGITEGELNAVLHCLDAKTVHFQKDEYILRSGDTVESLGLIVSGNALITQEDFWGNCNILSSVEQGQCFGETFACASGSILNVNVVAQSQAVVLFLDVRRILTMCPSSCAHHSRIIRNLLSDLANKNLHFNEKVTHLGQRTTRAKLLSYLSAEAQRHNNAAFDIPYSRQQLADYLSVERSGLSLALSKLRNEGLVEFHKNHFLLKEQALSEILR